MPIIRTTTTTEHTLAEPVILTGTSTQSIVVEQATVIEITDGEQKPFRQVFVHGYVVDDEGIRTGARVFQHYVTDTDQIANLLAHIAREN